MEFTTAESEAYPRSPEVTKAIKDMGFIPLWCRWGVYNPSADIEPIVFGRHAVGSYKSTPSEDKQVYQLIKTHPGYTGPRPNQIDLIWMGERNADAPDLP